MQRIFREDTKKHNVILFSFSTLIWNLIVSKEKEDEAHELSGNSGHGRCQALSLSGLCLHNDKHRENGKKKKERKELDGSYRDLKRTI